MDSLEAAESREGPIGSERAQRASETIESLYERHSQSTYAFFLNRVRSASLAADLNQELYLRVMRSLEVYRSECSWRTWIFAIARNVLADARRAAWSRVADRHVELDRARLLVDLSSESDADGKAMAVLLRERLIRCLRLLDELARMVIVSHYFHGITLRELTERMKLDNASGSRALLLAGQRKLRRCMNEGKRDRD